MAIVACECTGRASMAPVHAEVDYYSKGGVLGGIVITLLP